ncbi:hypothetical protein CP8484711_2015, partial [Chlamydia psittaci 84-8471/1]
SRRS